MTTSFILHENGKIYRVTMRGAYIETITSEKKLRVAVAKAAKAIYHKDFTPDNFPHTTFIGMCSTLGIIGKITCNGH